MHLPLILTAGLLAVVLGIVLLAFSGRSMTPVYFLFAFPLGVYWVSHSASWLVFIVAIYQSAFTLPLVPTNTNLFQILATAFSGLMAIYPAVNRQAWYRRTPVRKWILGMAVVLAFVISQRGIGIRFFGSSLWGGAGYVTLFVSILLFGAGGLTTLSPLQWRRAIFGMCLLAFIPLIAQLLYTYSGGSISQQYLFIQETGFVKSNEEILETQQGVLRFQSGVGIYLILIPLICLVHPFRGFNLGVTALTMVISLVAISFSGYRGGMLAALLIPGTWLFLGEKRVQWVRALVLIGCGLLLLWILGLHGRMFPLPVQRALSFMPMADVSFEAANDATGTLHWRLEVWKRAMAEYLPDHWLVGQGLAFDPRALQEAVNLGLYHRDWAFITRSYHNGVISLLLILGLPGLLVGLGFIGASLREYFRLLRLDWPNPLLFRIYRAVFAWFAVMAVSFCTTYGDLQISFPQLFFIAMILEGLAKTRESLLRKTGEEAGRP